MLGQMEMVPRGQPAVKESWKRERMEKMALQEGQGAPGSDSKGSSYLTQSLHPEVQLEGNEFGESGDQESELARNSEKGCWTNSLCATLKSLSSTL